MIDFRPTAPAGMVKADCRVTVIAIDVFIFNRPERPGIAEIVTGLE
jgi:hypothetical protein